MKDFLPINCWAAEDRPSSKMDNLGLDGLTNAELLSIIIGSGSAGNSAVDVARRLLSSHDNSLRSLKSCNKKELSSIPGIGEAKAGKILASLELGSRMTEEATGIKPILNCAVRVYNYLLPQMMGLDVEEFWAVFCNQHFGLIKARQMFTGGITEVAVDVRLVVKEAIMNNATVVYVAHNHPSGSLSPSREDDNITLSLRKACDALRLHFADQLIMIDGNYYSYHENGRL